MNSDEVSDADTINHVNDTDLYILLLGYTNRHVRSEWMWLL